MRMWPSWLRRHVANVEIASSSLAVRTEIMIPVQLLEWAGLELDLIPHLTSHDLPRARGWNWNTRTAQTRMPARA